MIQHGVLWDIGLFNCEICEVGQLEVLLARATTSLELSVSACLSALVCMCLFSCLPVTGKRGSGMINSAVFNCNVKYVNFIKFLLVQEFKLGMRLKGTCMPQ